jgi:integrase
MNKVQKFGTWLKQNPGRATLYALCIVGGLGLLVGVIIAIVYAAKRRGPRPFFLETANMIIRETDARKFYSIDSTDQLLGLNQKGDLVDGDGTILLAGIGKDAADLTKRPLTYEMGHPYWTNEWGQLSEENWKIYAERFQKNTIVPGSYTGTVLVIEANGVHTSGNGYDYAPTYLASSLDVVGIVVRKGGILILGDPGKPWKIRTQFILVESGGVIQAGSSHQQSHRYRGSLTIELSHPPGGHDAMGTVASQYTYRCYAPGTRRMEDLPLTQTDQLQSTFDGTTMAFSNTFGCKVIAVGFNGQLHLAGNIPYVDVPYRGTWKSYKGTNPADPWLTADDSPDIFKTTEKAAAVIAGIPIEYPCTWLRMANGKWKKGGNYVDLEVDDASILAHLEDTWVPGARVVLTGRSEQYTNYPNDPEGMLCSWVDNDVDVERAANALANQKFQDKFKGKGADNGWDPDKSNGCEAARIDRLELMSGGFIRLHLKDGMQFDHDSTFTTLTRTPEDSLSPADKIITIGTSLHVGLLTHSIRITSFLSSGGTGANVGPGKRPSPVKGTWYGPGGSMRCNSNAYIANGEIYANCYKNLALNNEKFCNNMDPPAVANGTWILGSQTLTGSNSIFCGHQMFRYGSSVSLDGVEMHKLGTPANFGAKARYATHFHLSGYPRRWRGYLPDGTDGQGKSSTGWAFRRSARVENCSLWCIPSRYVSMHGVHDALFRNNVGFISYGSGVFVEDGTETGNEIDHNLLTWQVLYQYNSYYNTVPLYGYVSTDYSTSSTIWLFYEISIISAENSINYVYKSIINKSFAVNFGFRMINKNKTGSKLMVIYKDIKGGPKPTLGTIAGKKRKKEILSDETPVFGEKKLDFRKKQKCGASQQLVCGEKEGLATFAMKAATSGFMLPCGRALMTFAPSFRIDRASAAKLSLGTISSTAKPTPTSLALLAAHVRTTATTTSAIRRLASALMMDGFHDEYLRMITDRENLTETDATDFQNVVQAHYHRPKRYIYLPKTGDMHRWDQQSFVNAVLQLRCIEGADVPIAEIIPKLTEQNSLSLVTPDVGACVPGFGKCLLLRHFACKHMDSIDKRISLMKQALLVFQKVKAVTTECTLTEGMFVRFGLQCGLPWSDILQRTDAEIAGFTFNFLSRKPSYCLSYIRAVLSFYNAFERIPHIQAIVAARTSRAYLPRGPTVRPTLMAPAVSRPLAGTQDKWYHKQKTGPQADWTIALAVAAILPALPDALVSSASNRAFLAWLQGIQWTYTVHANLSSNLREAGFHEDYICQVNKMTAISSQDEGFYQNLLTKAKPNKRLHQHNGKTYNTFTTPNGKARITRNSFLRMVYSLRASVEQVGTVEQMVRSLTEDGMYTFLVSTNGVLSSFHFFVVQVAGNDNIQLAQDVQSLLTTAQRDFKTLSNRGLAAGLKYSYFIRVCVALRVQPSLISSLMPETVIKRMANLPTTYSHKEALRYITAMLSHQRKFQYVAQLEKLLSPGSRLSNKFENFSYGSSWRTDLLSDIKTQHSNRCRHTSAYPDKQVKICMHEELCALLFIEEWTKKNKEAYTGDYLQHFMKTAVRKDFEDVAVEYGSAVSVHNENVRSSRSAHPSTQRVARLLCLLRIRCRKHIGDSIGIAQVKVAEILMQIPNERIRASKLVRRTYSDKEMIAMAEVVKGDVRATLMLRIFRYVGLRHGAVAHLRFCQLFCENDVPRTICRVQEKGNKLREFVTPPQVIEAARAYVVQARIWKPDLHPEKFYLFGDDHSQPCTTINDEMRRFGMAANVQVRIYPHAFRHTIVGELVEKGHNIDDISSWLGHSDSRTTSTHYYVPSVLEVHEKLFLNAVKSPDKNIIKECEHKVRKSQREAEISRTTLDVYNTQISAIAEKYPEAAKVLILSLQDHLPDLRERLKSMNDIEDVNTEADSDVSLSPWTSECSSPRSISPMPDHFSVGFDCLRCQDIDSDGDEEEWENVGKDLTDDAGSDAGSDDGSNSNEDCSLDLHD